MEHFDYERIKNEECTREFIIKRLGLVPTTPGGNRLRLENCILESQEKQILSLETVSALFEGFQKITPDPIVRPEGDSTLFTTAGLQHLETLTRKGDPLGRRELLISQPVIRSQFLDKISEGTSTSFINITSLVTEASPAEYISLCKKLISLLTSSGVGDSELEFVVENDEVTQRNVTFTNISTTVWFRGIEIGDCVYIHRYPFGLDGEKSVADLGFGLERFNWGITESDYYFEEQKEIYKDNPNLSKDTVAGLIDPIRSMVLIAGDGVKPSNNNHGYRLRQFSKRFVARNQGLGLNAIKIAETCFDTWIKYGNHPIVSKEDTLSVISAENERNLNALFLKVLRDEKGIDLYLDINQSNSSFVRQLGFSLTQDVITEISQKIL